MRFAAQERATVWKNTFTTSIGTVPEKFLIVVPTHALAEQFKQELQSFENPKSSHLRWRCDSQPEKYSGEQLPNECGDNHPRMFHQLLPPRYRSILRCALYWQNTTWWLTRSDGWFGAEAKIRHADRTAENFPFLAWLEERNGFSICVMSTTTSCTSITMKTR